MEHLNLRVELGVVVQAFKLAWEPQKRGQPPLDRCPQFQRGRGYIATPHFKAQDKVKPNKPAEELG